MTSGRNTNRHMWYCYFDVFNDVGKYCFINACQFPEYVAKRMGKLNSILYLSFVFGFVYFFSNLMLFIGKSQKFYIQVVSPSEMYLYVSSMLVYMIIIPFDCGYEFGDFKLNNLRSMKSNTWLLLGIRCLYNKQL